MGQRAGACSKDSPRDPMAQGAAGSCVLRPAAPLWTSTTGARPLPPLLGLARLRSLVHEAQQHECQHGAQTSAGPCPALCSLRHQESKRSNSSASTTSFLMLQTASVRHPWFHRVWMLLLWPCSASSQCGPGPLLLHGHAAVAPPAPRDLLMASPGRAPAARLEPHLHQPL